MSWRGSCLLLCVLQLPCFFLQRKISLCGQGQGERVSRRRSDGRGVRACNESGEVNERVKASVGERKCERRAGPVGPGWSVVLVGNGSSGLLRIRSPRREVSIV